MAQQQGLNHTEKNTSLTPTQTQIGEAVRDGVKHEAIVYKSAKEELNAILQNEYIASLYLIFCLCAATVCFFNIMRLTKKHMPLSFNHPLIGKTPHDYLSLLVEKPSTIFSDYFCPLFTKHFKWNYAIKFILGFILFFFLLLPICFNLIERFFGSKKIKTIYRERKVNKINETKYYSQLDKFYLSENIRWAILIGLNVLILNLLFFDLPTIFYKAEKFFDVRIIFLCAVYIMVPAFICFHFLHKRTYLNIKAKTPDLYFWSLWHLYILLVLYLLPLYIINEYKSDDLVYGSKNLVSQLFSTAVHGGWFFGAISYLWKKFVKEDF
tara:strand:+ start:599 stop:1570 length:972 start_codon:yes stop_codon:yes gene_type:complete